MIWDGLMINSERIRGLLPFPLPKPRKKFRGLDIVSIVTGYCFNWVSSFSLMSQSLYVLLKSN